MFEARQQIRGTALSAEIALHCTGVGLTHCTGVITVVISVVTNCCSQRPENMLQRCVAHIEGSCISRSCECSSRHHTKCVNGSGAPAGTRGEACPGMVISMAGCATP